jgi:Family of unknown function (DUF5906)
MTDQPKFAAKTSAPRAPTGADTNGEGVTLADFVSHMPSHKYIFMPCCEFWPAVSVNARIEPQPIFTKSGKQRLDNNGKPLFMPASRWLDQNKPVEQVTWFPGEPVLIRDRLVVDGGIIHRRGVATFNRYRPPRLKLDDPRKAGPWVRHARRVFGRDALHLIRWFAHRVQRPGEKINHALLLGGEQQGTGKDTLLEPVRQAIGPWNFGDISPSQFLGRFNSFGRSVILRVNEARDQGETDRFKFYDHCKTAVVTPPSTLRLDEKFQPEYYIINCLGFIITTNHRDGIYLPPEDRRHYVAWSARRMSDYEPDYWPKLWHWYENEGGYGHVAAYLAAFDLSGFDPKAPPPKTAAFWDIVNLNASPEDHELSDVIDLLGKPDPNYPGRIIQPDALTMTSLIAKASGTLLDTMMERKNFRALKHRLSRCKYVFVSNPDREDGRWTIGGKQETAYAKVSLSPQEREQAVRELGLEAEKG